MKVSVIVPTCNELNALTDCLDSLAENAPSTETIVVNGPSSDGTSGTVRARDDVDLLLECSSRNLNVARNAGLRAATGDVFALLAPAYCIQSEWFDAIIESLEGSADLVTGPVELVEESEEPRELVPSDRLRIMGGNLALSRDAVTALDGFDEYLITGGAKDIGQRLGGQDLHVTWHPEMSVRQNPDETVRHQRQHRGGYNAAWQGLDSTDWGGMYRSLAYRIVKNDGVRPRVFLTIVGSAIRDAVATAKEVLHGTGTPSGWFNTGLGVLRNTLRGGIDGFRARSDDGTPARNPHGVSRTESDVVVDKYVEE